MTDTDKGPWWWTDAMDAVWAAQRRRSEMARLPSGRFLIQVIGPEVILFEEHTERELVRFDPDDADSTRAGLVAITNADIPVEDVTYALFWSGYFYAHTKIEKGYQ